MGSSLGMILENRLRREWMPSDSPPLSFLTWRPPPPPNSEQIQAKPVASSPMTGQEDQGEARAGEVTPKEVKQPQTRQRFSLGQLNEIPTPLLYIPASPCPDHDHSTNPGHHNALNFQNSSSHNSRLPAILYQQLENSNQRDGYTTQYRAFISFYTLHRNRPVHRSGPYRRTTERS